jgi:hypothetical protein
MNETSAEGGREPATSGGVVLAAISILATVLVVAGLLYATGIGARRKVLLAAGGCAPVPGLTVTGLDCTTEQQLASQYQQMTTPVDNQMTTYAGAYTASEFHNLAAARGILTAEVAVENSLDTSLKHFSFPAFITPAANRLIRDNEALAKLTAQQAQSSSLIQLRSFNDRVAAASAAVRSGLELVGTALAKPPTANEEP